jgi:glutathione S-transferase
MSPTVPRPLLYSFRRCPYAMRARLALHQAGITVTLAEVALRDKPAALLAISPKGTVPVLQLPDGTVLEQSLDIMRWALAQHDPQGWLTQAPLDAMLTLIGRNDGPFKAALDHYKYPERNPDQTREATRAHALALHLLPLEAQLAHAPYLFGAQASLADMALLPFVRQFAQVDRAWWDGAAPLPRLRDWLQGLTNTALFQQVMAKA